MVHSLCLERRDSSLSSSAEGVLFGLEMLDYHFSVMQNAMKFALKLFLV
jgi:hypothetical protein